MTFFLRMKHWQLFILLIGVPVLIQIFLIWSIFSTGGTHAIFYIFPVLMIYCMAVLFGWLYSMGAGLNQKLPADLNISTAFFKTAMALPSGYMALTYVFVFGAFSKELQTDANLLIPLVILPLHLFSMFCIFYSLYFVARSLRTVELQRVVTYQDYLGEFFLLWFFPVGIWVLQPRINKLFAEPQNAAA